MSEETPGDDAPIEIDVDAGVSAVLLDVGGVLVVPHPEVVREGLADVAHLDAVDDQLFVQAHYRGMAALDSVVGDGPPWPAYFMAYCAHLGVAGSDEVLGVMRDLWATRARDLWCYSLADNVRALRGLRAAGIPVAIVSNADGTVEELLGRLAIAQAGPGPGAEVSVVVDSAVIGVEKPDPAIFSPALEALGIDPAQGVYVGDSARFDVAGATAAGLHPVLLSPESRLGGDPAPRIASLLDLLAVLT